MNGHISIIIKVHLQPDYLATYLYDLTKTKFGNTAQHFILILEHVDGSSRPNSSKNIHFPCWKGSATHFIILISEHVDVSSRHIPS